MLSRYNFEIKLIDSPTADDLFDLVFTGAKAGWFEDVSRFPIAKKHCVVDHGAKVWTYRSVEKHARAGTRAYQMFAN